MKIEIYCDGACRGNQNKENLGSWGAWLKCGEKEKEIYGVVENTTNNMMELTACIEALKCIKNLNAEIIVYTDSQYVFSGITQWIEGWKKKNWRNSNKKLVLNADLWKELDCLKSKFKNLKFEKVTGHSGNYGNEKADYLCNLALDNYKK